MTAKKKTETRADLQRQVKELNAQLAHVYYFAHQELPKASTKHMMASGVLLTVTALGGRQLMTPVLIRDGLSDDTIAALQRDLVRSYELMMTFKPAGAGVGAGEPT